MSLDVVAVENALTDIEEGMVVDEARAGELAGRGPHDGMKVRAVPDQQGAVALLGRDDRHQRAVTGEGRLQVAGPLIREEGLDHSGREVDLHQVVEGAADL